MPTKKEKKEFEDLIDFLATVRLVLDGPSKISLAFLLALWNGEKVRARALKPDHPDADRIEIAFEFGLQCKPLNDEIKAEVIKFALTAILIAIGLKR
jgi:hypothetical protein